MREVSATSTLRRLGFADPKRAETMLASQALAGLEIAPLLGASPDPDQALLTFLRLAESDRTRLEKVLASDDAARRLASVCGMSTALGDLLVRHTSWLDLLLTPEAADRDPELEREHILTALKTGGETPVSPLDWDEGLISLRQAYYQRLITMAADDLTNPDPLDAMPRVAQGMSDLVDATLEGALALARNHVPDSDKVRLAIIAMGKTGARELNYISDVDVIFAIESDLPEDEAIQIGTALATRVVRSTTAPSSEVGLWPIDPNLRPEGKDGPLVRTVASHVAYYERWAKNWEFQALLKARCAAGDRHVGQAYIDATRPFVWTAAARDGFVESARAMRKRVEDTINPKEAPRQLKLGKGGLRDVEFTVQLLQLVHGRVDETLRVANTLEGIAALRDGGYIARQDAADLDHHYRFLRALEHRIQLQKLKRSHVVPTSEESLRRIARSMGVSADELEARWQKIKASVRGMHESIFYRPLLPAAATLSDGEISLDVEAAYDRLQGIGYKDPKRAITHITALTEGISRTAKIQRQLLPVLIGWFADGPEPDNALLQFRVLSEEMGRTHWYLKLLRDSGLAAQRLAHILSTSTYLAQQIPKHTESVGWLDNDDELRSRSLPELRAELASLMSRRTDPGEIADAGRYLRRRIILRASLGFVAGVVSSDELREAVSHGAEIAIEAGLKAAQTKVLTERGLEEAPSRYLVVAMGSFGGADMGFASDCDILFVHEPITGGENAEDVATDVASTLISLLGTGGSEEPLKLDADLRPEGRNGALARSLDAYREYYERWAEPWERQALLRARPVVGDEELGEKFLALINPIRYERPLNHDELRDFRRMKARIESERLPRGVRPASHIKLGPGGLVDIEWVVQLLQLTHGASFPELRSPSTIAGLEGARAAGVLSTDDSEKLCEAWAYSQLLRQAIFLAGANPRRADIIPDNITVLARVAALMGLERAGDVEETHQRLNRRSRGVAETIVYGPTTLKE